MKIKKTKKVAKISTLEMHEKQKQEFNYEPMRDPIHNYVDYNTELEEKIIDTYIFQRLRRLYQLQSGRFVYPGATHSRFSHSLGTMHIAGKFAERVLYSPISKIETTEDSNFLYESVRLAGLLHDIGHGPFSHAFDEAIIAPSSTLKSKGIESHEDLGRVLIEHSEINKYLTNKENKEIIDDYTEIIKKLLSKKLSPTEDKAIIALRHIIKEFIYPADILDFLQRDAYFTGTREYGLIDCDRLIRSTSVRQSDLVLDYRALTTCRSYFNSRFKMFENVYFHRTCRAIDYMIKKIMTLANNSLNLEGKVEQCLKGEIQEFLELDDYSFFDMILKKGKEENSKEMISAKEIVTSILERKIPWRMPPCNRRSIPFTKGQVSQYRLALSGIEEKKKQLESCLEEKFDNYLRDKKDIFFVDHSRYKYLPDSPFDISGKIIIRKVSGNTESIEEWSISNLLEEHPTSYYIEFRVYVNKKLHDQNTKKMDKTIQDAFQDVFGIPSPGPTY
jgi:hypothetical protein